MKTHYIQDKYNPLKFWIVRKTDCRHYQVTQAITNLQGVMMRQYKFRRESLYRISELTWQDKNVIKALFKA
jgi:hypothetical protein